MDIEKLKELAIAAMQMPKPCKLKSCHCNDRPRAVARFREALTPEVALELIAELES